MMNMDIYIDNILNDEKLQLLFQQMNIGQEKQRELGLVFYQNFIQSPTTDYYLKTIKDALLKISSLSLIQDDLQDIIKDIANSIHQHSIIFQKTIQHVENIEFPGRALRRLDTAVYDDVHGRIRRIYGRIRAVF
ncbi:unnamed protein product [Rotaria socialis]|uniref:Uncharacterized protein n=1 Tax=Rotaria socialis TaxID=392032 RepID=A0A818KQL9_9BILA|nr:unnamed protein product [Rotaria socialis]CAF3521722.1 unnamed protein product [Rotaria socialis]CAF3556065.1 unnamed protein product [Rotaria socialis]CAF3627081.1 unnamed protein product [Rotaria socialis]CAF3754902.1 unnamed protein product [Rotaria socialis]